jgi:putative SOS response-associated peptidase YedK
MCNLYSITTNQAAIIALFRVINQSVGNLPPMPGVFPDYPAPVVRNDGGEREMVMMRWGMPPPPKLGGPPVTNIRNTSSPHWRAWLKPENRCLVPFNSFAEYAPEPDPETKKKDVVWFALNEERPLAAFAGIWTGKGGVCRKVGATANLDSSCARRLERSADRDEETAFRSNKETGEEKKGALPNLLDKKAPYKGPWCRFRREARARE